MDFTLPTCLLLGNEDGGLTPEALAGADGVVAIPMEGMGTSLNVSVAAALLLFEAQRQRRAAGFYDAPRLDPAGLRADPLRVDLPGIAARAGSGGRPTRRWAEDGEILGAVPR